MTQRSDAAEGHGAVARKHRRGSQSESKRSANLGHGNFSQTKPDSLAIEMRPTSVANNVIADVREALHQLQVCLAQSRQFEPSIARNSFNISLQIFCIIYIQIYFILN